PAVAGGGGGGGGGAGGGRPSATRPDPARVPRTASRAERATFPGWPRRLVPRRRDEHRHGRLACGVDRPARLPRRLRRTCRRGVYVAGRHRSACPVASVAPPAGSIVGHAPVPPAPRTAPRRRPPPSIWCAVARVLHRPPGWIVRAERVGDRGRIYDARPARGTGGPTRGQLPGRRADLARRDRRAVHCRAPAHASRSRLAPCA